ncbi:hypothetical protein Ancab_038465 [Ancistrocladus abbreviatus]
MILNPCTKSLIYLFSKHHPSYFPFSLSLHFFSASPSRKQNPLAQYLIKRHGFSPETASKASSSITHLKNYSKSDSILEYLKESGFSKTQLEGMIERVPNILLSDLEKTIKPKIQTFHDLGFPSKEIAEVLSSDPWVLTKRKADRLVQSVLVLENVLGSGLCVRKALKASQWFLKWDLEKTLVPNIEFLRSCGISLSQIPAFIYNFPRFLLYRPETMKEFVKRVDELGFDRNSKMFLLAVRTVGSMTIENWELKLKLFQELGFSKDDTLTAFKRSPQVFALSERKIRENADFLLAEAKVDISWIAQNLTLLTMSLNHRIRPRLKVVDVLKAKNLIIREPSLSTVCKLSKRQFFMKYVHPHLDLVGELYTSTVS